MLTQSHNLPGTKFTPGATSQTQQASVSMLKASSVYKEYSMYVCKATSEQTTRLLVKCPLHRRDQTRHANHKAQGWRGDYLG